jgi:hypothetical protein
MSKLRCHISISADGFVAGPNQSEENPLGEEHADHPHPSPARAGRDGGGTTFHFVTDGIERALERAKESADGQDVRPQVRGFARKKVGSDASDQRS